ncbi:MAG TPA: DPP IV N-terminal domain-containing protein, partial [Bacteroidota bacterium]|nr:DPP IV N-terminal domain-containing protein [Bacteroidota bacterium]
MKKLFLFVFLCIPLYAQPQPRVFTAADYARAEKFLAPNVSNLVVGGAVIATWLPDERFWYRNTTMTGVEYVIIDPAKKIRSPYSPTPSDTAGQSAGRGFGQRGPAGTAVKSPDGKSEAFIRSWNLWVRDIATKKERQLTTDGVENFGYATDNAGWRKSDRAILLWSPDSRKIATQQQDEQNVGEMYLVETKVNHPVLQAWKYPLPGDSVVAMIHRVIIEVDGPRVIRFQMPPDYHRGTVEDDITTQDYKWSPDGKRFAFISTSRVHKDAWVRVADATSGEVR